MVLSFSMNNIDYPTTTIVKAYTMTFGYNRAWLYSSRSKKIVYYVFIDGRGGYDTAFCSYKFKIHTSELFEETLINILSKPGFYEKYSEHNNATLRNAARFAKYRGTYDYDMMYGLCARDSMNLHGKNKLFNSSLEVKQYIDEHSNVVMNPFLDYYALLESKPSETELMLLTKSENKFISDYACKHFEQ